MVAILGLALGAWKLFGAGIARIDFAAAAQGTLNLTRGIQAVGTAAVVAGTKMAAFGTIMRVAFGAIFAIVATVTIVRQAMDLFGKSADVAKERQERFNEGFDRIRQ